ncbi:hypothetical protein [Roseibium aggregatum]|uniref:Uncharacterized protein n=1 Tax=Roseibium aggregatum TaxID=187304 RepID=A0A926NWR8_9HYPH|nr:hypothetical protein [Roseibium aggregatum]MBD1548772.1 hypothetical protein [Roseibium aggregatum]
MSDSARNNDPERMAETNRLNRDIAQEAGTDSELESIVPPVSQTGNWWRIGAAICLVLVLLIIASFFI